MSAPAPATERRRIPAIDGMRAIAVMMLVVGHWGRNQPDAEFQGLEPLAGDGVILLLVITGFVVTTTLLRDLDGGRASTLTAWATRKTLRTFPTLIAVVLAATAIQQFKNGIPVPTGRYVGFLSLFGNYYYALAEGDPLRHSLGHLWSLMVGAQFIVPWVLVLRWAHAADRITQVTTGVGCVFVASSIVRVVYGYAEGVPPAYAYLATEARVADVAVGAWAALLLRRHPSFDSTRPRSWIPAIASLTALVATFSFTSPALPPLRLALIAYLLAWLVAQNAEGPFRVLRSRPLLGLSTISYSVFAWHLYGLRVEQLVLEWPWLPRKAVAVTGVLCAGAVAFVLLEWPARKWLPDARTVARSTRN